MIRKKPAHIRFRKRYMLSLCFGAACCLLYGCAIDRGPVCIRNGVRYGITVGLFESEWDDYYERGLSYMEGGCYHAALSDLNEAVRQRFEDQWMARTYGIHYIDYFPHREIGLIHYLMGNYENARTQLELSATQEPSEKAFYYLDKIRKNVIENAKTSDTRPKIVLNTTKDLRTKDDLVVISGIVTDDNYVDGIWLQERPLVVERSAREIRFAEKLYLDEGEHLIDVKARNLIDKTAVQTLKILIDRSGPVISIDGFTKTEPALGASPILSGWLHDASGVHSLKIGDIDIPITRDKTTGFLAAIPSETKKISIQAEDRLGNRTNTRLRIEDLQDPSSPKLTAFLNTPATADIDPSFYASAAETAPKIQIHGLSDKDAVYTRQINVSGSIACATPIVDITLNRQPIPFRQSAMVLFSRSVQLSPGTNVIDVTARNDDGEQSTETLWIHRNIPEVFKLSHRYGFSLHPFDSIEGKRHDVLFQYRLFKKFEEQKRFRTIPTENFLAVLQRQGLESPPPVDPMPSEASLLGIIYATRNGTEIVTRLVDNQSGKIITIQDGYQEKSLRNRTTAENLAYRISEKYLKEFPIVDCFIRETDKDGLVAETGKNRLRVKWPLLIYRRSPLANRSQNDIFLGYETEIIGTAYVNRLTKNIFQAKILDVDNAHIQISDRLITR